MHAGWPALAAARRGDRAARVPLWIGERRVGSVARVQLDALGRLAGPGWQVDDQGVRLEGRDADASLAALNLALRAQGRIRGWRDECFPVLDDEGRVVATMERAACRFWGTLTRAAHVNGHVVSAAGTVQALWIARRAFDKATDPGLFDNLVGGGVPMGQTPWETLLREGGEEAGLDAATMARATPGRVIRIDAEVPEGWQREDLHVYDLALDAGMVPVNQDGEVQGFTCLPLHEALDLAAGRDPLRTMTVDAALVTLDFAARRGLLGETDKDAARALAALCRPA